MDWVEFSAGLFLLLSAPVQNQCNIGTFMIWNAGCRVDNASLGQAIGQVVLLDKLIQSPKTVSIASTGTAHVW